MVPDYYKKYGLCRTIDGQKKSLKMHLKNLQRMHKFTRNYIENTEKDLNSKDLDESQKAQIQRSLERAIKRLQQIEIDIISIENIMPLDEDVSETQLREDEITNVYISTIMYDKHISGIELKLYNLVNEKDLEKRNYEEAKLHEELKDIFRVQAILGNAQNRRKYLAELEYQEYLEYLESCRQARIGEEKKYVHNILGNNFNPDLSKCQQSLGDYQWQIRLYERPEEVFIGKSNYPGKPQMNQEIHAYRYGTFEYATFFNEKGNPVYKDSLCEVIGITKKAVDGTEHISFVIAPLKYLREINLKTTDQDERNVRETTNGQTSESERKFKRNKSLWKRIFSKKNGTKERSFTNNNSKKYTASANNSMMRKIQKIILEEGKYQVTEEDREFFANVYLSDYLIDNAEKNNSHYLGDYNFAKSKKEIRLDSKMDYERVNACYFAKNMPGIILGNESVKRVANIDEVFNKLREIQNILVQGAIRKEKKSFKEERTVED